MNPEIGGFEQNGQDPQEVAYLLGKLFALTDSKVAQEHLLPQLAEIGAQKLPPEEVVPSVIEKVSVFAQENMNGMEVLALNQVPYYIEVLVEDPEENKEAMSIWHEFVEEHRGNAEVVEAKRPRKLKKAMAKPRSVQRPGDKARVDRYSRRNRPN